MSDRSLPLSVFSLLGCLLLCPHLLFLLPLLLSLLSLFLQLLLLLHLFILLVLLLLLPLLFHLLLLLPSSLFYMYFSPFSCPSSPVPLSEWICVITVHRKDHKVKELPTRALKV